MDMDRRELADFLRRSRERLRPREVGRPAGPRRRTPGLRREEVSPAAEAIFGCVCTVDGPDRNIVWRWFTDPSVRSAYPAEDHERVARTHVADLRAAVARRGHDAAASALVERLHGTGGEFTRLWEPHEVAVRRTSRMRVLHPEVGTVEFDAEVLVTPAEDQRLVVYAPPPGSRSVEALELLRVIGPQTAHRSHAAGATAT
ncbi:hypothetical protein [Actinomadura sp. LOL_011]|uniref:MmyB family transcriptional regulator n=1 Tax=Actinomadura sp. LOL_011 TaxID=3345410 RepID=UPI003A80BD08